jgi:signal transduction histidine kinase
MPSPVDHAPTADRLTTGVPRGTCLRLLRRRACHPRVRAVAPWVLDAALVLLVFVATFGQLGALGAPEGRYAAIDGLGVWLGFTATLPLLLRRIAPVPVLALTAAASVALIALDYGAVFSFSPAVALYTVARASAPSDRRAGAVIGVVAWGAILYAQLLVSDLPRDQFLYDGMAWLVGWFTGHSLRQAAERRGAQAESDALRARDAERERRLVVAGERERLARDLHDSAGHAINVILVQAGAARLLRERDPQGATTALETIEQVARQTIGDIDRLVGTLRDDATLGGPPGVGSIETLAAHHRAGGLDVDVYVTGRPTMSTRPATASSRRA